MESKKLVVTFPDEALYDQLSRMAEKWHMSRADVIRTCLRAFLRASPVFSLKITDEDGTEFVR